MRVRASWWRSRIAAATALLAAALVVSGPSRPAAADAVSLEFVGQLPVGPNDVIIPDSAKRQLIVLGNTGSGGGSAPAVIRTFDADTLTLVRTLTLPTFKLPGGGRGSPKAYAWDQPSRRLYLAVYPDINAQTVPTLATLEGGERVISTVSMATAMSPSISIQGMSYHAPSGHLYVLGGDQTALVGSNLVQVNEIDANTGAALWPSPYTVPSCQRPVTGKRQAAVVRGVGAELFMACGTGSLGDLVPQPGSFPGVVRVDFSNPASPTSVLYPVPGSYTFGASLYDAEGGRFIMVSAAPSAPVQAAWVFDQAHRVWLGNVSAGQINVKDAEVAPTGGRLYVAIDHNLLVSSTRGPKIPQALKLPSPHIEGYLVAVPFNRTVILADINTFTTIRKVYRLDIDPYVPPPPVDHDAGTSDLKEGPTAGSTFGADAKAFGMRVHQIAGVNGVQQNAVPGPNLFETTKQQANNAGTAAKQPTVFPYNDTDRDIYLARVLGGRLSPLEATASATTEDADTYTQQDYKSAGGSDWPYKIANCADFGTGASTKAETAASVACDTKGSQVTATTTNDERGFGSDTLTLVSSGSTFAKTVLKRDPDAGAVTSSEAYAKDVNIAGVATFGEIRSLSESAAHGRPGTAKGTYTRTFKDVTIGTFHCGDDTSPPCDPQQVANQLGLALGSKFQVELPDKEIMATPRGARGSVLRDPWQHQQDIALSNQAEAELQTPALRIIYLNDNAARSRIIFEFAATLADTSYRIYPIELGGPPDLEEFVAGSALDSITDEITTIDSSDDGAIEGLDPSVAGAGGGSGVGSLVASRRGLLRGHGLRFLLSGRNAVILGTLLWGLFVLPGFLAGRRRHLLRVIGDTR